MLAWVQERLTEHMLPPAWDELLSEATQRFFPKLPTISPEGQDTTAARRLWRARRLPADASLEEQQAPVALSPTSASGAADKEGTRRHRF